MYFRYHLFAILKEVYYENESNSPKHSKIIKQSAIKIDNSK